MNTALKLNTVIVLGHLNFLEMAVFGYSRVDACLSNTGYQFECKIGVCFKFEGNNLVTANNAKAICEGDGGHLVRIMNAEMNDFFVKLVGAPAYSATSRIFIDGSDVEAEGVWKFANGEMIICNDWRSGDPFYYAGGQCVTMFRPSNLKWVMTLCNSSSKTGGYICQIDV